MEATENNRETKTIVINNILLLKNKTRIGSWCNGGHRYSEVRNSKQGRFFSLTNCKELSFQCNSCQNALKGFVIHDPLVTHYKLQTLRTSGRERLEAHREFETAHLRTMTAEAT